MRRTLWFLALMMWAIQPARAADLPPPIEPPPFAPRWAGIYSALSAGGSWGQANWDRTGQFSESGWLVSGSIGYNFQINRIVVGAEGDLNWSSLTGTTTSNCPAGCETKTNFFSTVRGRLGYEFGPLLSYLTAGPAFGGIKASSVGFSGINSIRTGWVAGAGFEYAFSNAWSGRIEYLHFDLGQINCGLSCGTSSPDEVSQKADVIKVGLVYRFSPPPIEPPPFGRGK